jgi:hypothetical protein
VNRWLSVHDSTNTIVGSVVTVVWPTAGWLFLFHLFFFLVSVMCRTVGLLYLASILVVWLFYFSFRAGVGRCVVSVGVGACLA